MVKNNIFSVFFYHLILFFFKIEVQVSQISKSPSTYVKATLYPKCCLNMGWRFSQYDQDTSFAVSLYFYKDLRQRYYILRKYAMCKNIGGILVMINK